jgi:hypothetical protein
MNTLYTPPPDAVVESLGNDKYSTSWKNGTLLITLWYETNQTNWYHFQAVDGSNVYVTHERNLSTRIITRWFHCENTGPTQLFH